MSLGTILVIIALILAILAAIGVPSSRVSLGWAAIAFWIASILFGHVGLR